jgi:two-component system NtrC family sensor kinase
LSYNVCFSQNVEIDSLKSLLETTKVDSSRLTLNLLLSQRFARVNLDSSIYYAMQGQQLANIVKNDDLEFGFLMTLGSAYSERDIPKSMQLYYKALQLAERNNNKRQIAGCYSLIGLLHLYLGNSNLYIDYRKKAKKIYHELGITDAVAQADSEIGGAYVDLNADSARYYLTMASRNALKEKDPYHLYYWGRLETTENPQKAQAFFTKSIQILKETQQLRGISLASRWFSIFYQKQNQFDSAILIAKSGLLAAQQLNFPRGIIFNSEQLNTVYNKLNQTDSAYKYLSIMTEAKEDLFSQDKINQIQTAIIDEQLRAQQLEDEQIAYQNKIRFYVLFAVVIVVLLFALFFYLSQRKIHKSNQLLLKQSDEISEKNEELNASLKSLKATQAQLIQSEKMASLGELTAGIAHEIQNPLNFVNNFSEVSAELVEEIKETRIKSQETRPKTAEDEIEDEILEDIKQNLEKINHHGKRADAIVKGMLAHSRTSTGEKVRTDINALADEYLRLSYHGLRAKDKSFNADFSTDFDPNLPKISVIPQNIGRVLLNVINNAFQATNELSMGSEPLEGYKPLVTLSTKNLGDKIQISISDNGPGIPEHIKGKIFQPFFTTKPTGSGTGLGLSLSYDIVKAHGGELKVESTQGEGSEFVIYLTNVEATL